jgi:Sulfotransferase domain
MELKATENSSETIKPKIFGIGLSRTGTKSLNTALSILGYDSFHWPLSMKELERHEAVTDITVSSRFKALDAKFPESKFIYTVREIDSWLLSCRKHWRHLKTLRGTCKIPPFAEASELTLYETLDYDATILKRAYYKHHESVIGHFCRRQNDLLVLNIVAGDGWDKLCKFLKKPTPSIDFPRCR